MDFQYRHVNRTTYPQKHILICEDDLNNQSEMLSHLNTMFEPQGIVQVSVVPGAIAASAVIHNCRIDLIILDHDLPEGNGSDLLGWMKKEQKNIPVVTFSGIPENNLHMMNIGATHHFQKVEVIIGKADYLIKQILGL